MTPRLRPSPRPLLAAALPGMPSVCSRWHLLSVLGPPRARRPPVPPPPPPPCPGLCRRAGPCDPQGGLLTAQRQSLGVSAGALAPSPLLAPPPAPRVLAPQQCARGVHWASGSHVWALRVGWRGCMSAPRGCPSIGSRRAPPQRPAGPGSWPLAVSLPWGGGPGLCAYVEALVAFPYACHRNAVSLGTLDGGVRVTACCQGK